MKIAVANLNFEPDENFRKFLESLWIDDVHCDEFMYNQLIVDYIEKNANWKPWNSDAPAVKGKSSTKYRIGFSGAAQVIEVDTSRLWRLAWDNTDFPYPQYIEIHKDEHNRVWIEKKEK